MVETKIEAVPDGFIPMQALQGFSESLQPIYRRIEGGTVSIGIIVDNRHGNSMGICHGGALMTLADICAATGVIVARKVRAPIPTINLAIDFISAARMGQWIQADVQSVTIKRRFGFCSGLITNSDGVVARFNGTFYLPDHKGLEKRGATGDGISS